MIIIKKKKSTNNKLRKGDVITNIVLMLLVIAIFSVYVSTGTEKTKNISFSELQKLLKNDEVTGLKINEDSDFIDVTLSDGTLLKADNPKTESSLDKLYEFNVTIDRIESSGSILMVLFIIAFLYMIITLLTGAFNSVKKGSIGKSMFNEGINTDVKKPNVKFENVAGNEEAKESMQELVYYLQNPDKYKKYGIKAPKGAMLYGPPGTGKTLLAKAIAGEANANFLAVTGSDFVDKFVGNGASRVRHLFSEARKLQPCIVFIDEIDAVGLKRNSGVSNDERNQTLNALLAEMDGFSDDECIIVIGATNRLDSLDDALLRSGRFDTKIYIGLPDLKAREEIFKVHSTHKPVSTNVDFGSIAKMTTYFSGADIENVMNKAGFYAAKEEKEFIDSKDIDKAINHLIAGDAKKDRSGISEETKKLTAYHEAGHAVIAKLLAKINVPRITIIPTTHGAGGYTLIDSGESSYKSKQNILDEIAIALGGRAAEEIIFGAENVTTGASSDIKRVTDLAVNMITTYGMGNKFGMLALNENSNTKKEVFDEAKEIVDSIYKKTLLCLQDNYDVFDSLALRLLEKETVFEPEFENIIKGSEQLDLFKNIEE